MPDDVSPDADPRSIDNLLTKMLQWFELPQAPNGPRVPSLSSRGGVPPAMPPVPDNPHRIWGNQPPPMPPPPMHEQRYQSTVPLKRDGTPDYAAHARMNTTGRMPPDDVFPPGYTIAPDEWNSGTSGRSDNFDDRYSTWGQAPAVRYK